MNNYINNNNTNGDIKYNLETYRLCAPIETWNKIKNKMEIIKVKSIERIDNLDRIGIPVYCAIREVEYNGEISLKYHYGKGATNIQGKVSSCMEAIERHGMAKPNETPYNNPDNPINLKDLVLSKEAYKNLNNINNNLNSINWVSGEDIINNEIVDVPLECVCHPTEGKLFSSNTNGIASGNSKEEAIFHSTLELIERDGWSVAELLNKTHTKINIDNAKNPFIHQLMEKFKEANVNIILKDLTTEIGIPVIAAICDEPVLKDPALLCIGVGCHINPEIATIRALTEVIQSRATQIQNKRPDTVRGEIVRKVNYDRMIRIHKKWYSYKDEVSIEDLPDNSKLNIKKDMEFIKDKLFNCGFDKLIVSDLTKKEVGINVVRTTIPKLEVYCMDRNRISPYIRQRNKN